MRRAGVFMLLVGLVGTVGCGGDDSPTAPVAATPEPTPAPTPNPTPTPTPGPTGTCAAASADIVDARGDARSIPSTPAPDMVSARVSVHDCQFDVDVTFAPGALDFQKTVVFLSMDVDQKAATGDPYPQGLGTEYELQLGSGRNAFLMDAKADKVVSFFQITVINANTFRAQFPLSLLGNDDGRMNVRLRANVWGPNPSNPWAGMGRELDWMPDLGAAATRLQ